MAKTQIVVDGQSFRDGGAGAGESLFARPHTNIGAEGCVAAAEFGPSFGISGVLGRLAVIKNGFLGCGGVSFVPIKASSEEGLVGFGVGLRLARLAIQAGSGSLFFTDRTDGLILRIPLPE